MDNQILEGTKVDPETSLDVKGTVPESIMQMAEAATPEKLMRRFKGTETYTGKGNLIYERDEYWVIPVSAATYPNPEDYAIGTQFGEGKPKGRLFTGKNRKARRSEKHKKD